jgi:hypothetical protein
LGRIILFLSLSLSLSLSVFSTYCASATEGSDNRTLLAAPALPVPPRMSIGPLAAAPLADEKEEEEGGPPAASSAALAQSLPRPEDSRSS